MEQIETAIGILYDNSKYRAKRKSDWFWVPECDSEKPQVDLHKEILDSLYNAKYHLRDNGNSIKFYKKASELLIQQIEVLKSQGSG